MSMALKPLAELDAVLGLQATVGRLCRAWLALTVVPLFFQGKERVSWGTASVQSWASVAKFTS